MHACITQNCLLHCIIFASGPWDMVFAVLCKLSLALLYCTTRRHIITSFPWESHINAYCCDFLMAPWQLWQSIKTQDEPIFSVIFPQLFGGQILNDLLTEKEKRPVFLDVYINIHCSAHYTVYTAWWSTSENDSFDVASLILVAKQGKMIKRYKMGETHNCARSGSVGNLAQLLNGHKNESHQTCTS